MLAKIREKTQGIIATFILFLVAIPFVLWGIGSYFEGGSTAPVAEVNGIEISQQAFRQKLEEFQGLSQQRAESPQLKKLILDNLIDQTLLLAEVEDNGYRTSDAQLARIIQEIPYFQRDGKFEPGLYNALLRQQGLRPADFEARVRRDNLTVQLERGLSESAFATQAEIDAMLRLLQQERVVSYALITPDKFLPKITVSAQEVEDYYQSNQDSFRAPEAVRVEHLTLKADAVARQVSPSEEELRQAYAAEAARYVTPEKRKASHILIEVPAGAKDDEVEAARKRAEELLTQIRGGADFAALAKKHSSDAESAPKGGDLGFVTRGVLPAELENGVYALKPGEVSDIIRTSYGFHLTKVTALTPEERRSFEAVKKELTDMVQKRKGEERFYELAERFRNLVYENPEGLAAAAKQLGLEVETSDWFTRSGGAGVAARPKVVAAAFEADVLSGERNSDAVEVDPQTLVAVHVVDHRPSVVRPLSEVRANIERTLKEQRARERARAAAEEWVAKLNEGKSLKQLAGELGVPVEASKSVSREKSAGLLPQLSDAVFAAPKPGDQPVYGKVDLAAQGAAVFALEAVQEGDPAKADEALRARVRQQLLRRRGADYYASYRAGLRQGADVEINADQL